VIRVVDVHKSFGEKVIYRGLDLEIAEGSTHVIIGRSGEGKSVLLKHVSALMEPDAGEVWVDGRQVLARSRESVQHVRDRVTMVFQAGALFDSLTVRENVGFYLDQQRKKPRAEIDRICAELLDEVNLPDTGHLLPAELSGGMRKRVSLARALAAEPKIILYDEPTTGLDPVTTDVIGELIMKTARRHNVTSVVVSHDIKNAMKIGDQISMLYNGKIIFTGTPGELERSEDPVLFQFVNGFARGPITETEEEDVHRLSSELIDKSLLLRRIKQGNRE
jgi:phospholipid/cholesterol/gamma-HCH transport system ATP-binding protein